MSTMASQFSRAVFASYTDRKVVDLAEVCADLSQRGQWPRWKWSTASTKIGSFDGIKETEAYLRPLDLCNELRTQASGRGGGSSAENGRRCY